MILDKLNLMGQDQAITVTAFSTDVIDLGTASDVGVGAEIEVIAIVTEAFTAAGAATLTASVQGSADNSTFTDMAITPAIGKASLTVGAYVCKWDLPGIVAGQSLPRYIRMSYTVATGPMTAGKITAGLNLQRQDFRAYPPGITISN